MTKLRLPKPAAVNVVSRHLYLGSVYTKEQMRAFAEKAVKAEREACAEVCESMRPSEREFDQRFFTACTLNANAIRERGNK
jgi:predicted solute-binding protein